MSEEWLKSLPVGTTLYAPYHEHIEELQVVRAYNNKRALISVLVKRPHLKQMLPITPVNDKYIQYQFKPSTGNEHHEFSKWKIVLPHTI
jgi:hypothetical protein